MAVFLLDSNVCIDALRDPFGPVAQKISDNIGLGNTIITSSIVRYELELGARRSANPDVGVATIDRFLSDYISVMDFGVNEAQVAAGFTRELQHKGQNLQAFDALIAGHAIALKATFVTADVRLAAAMSENDVVNWR